MTAALAGAAMLGLEDASVSGSIFIGLGLTSFLITIVGLWVSSGFILKSAMMTGRASLGRRSRDSLVPPTQHKLSCRIVAILTFCVIALLITAAARNFL